MMSKSTRLSRRLVFAVAMIVCLVTASAAWALGRQDVYNLLNANLAPDVIVSVIRSSTDPVTMTEAEIEEMRAEGVPEQILAELCVRIGCGAAETPGPAAGGGAPGLEQELERQRQLDEERRQLEMERLEAERARMREQSGQPDPNAMAMAQHAQALNAADAELRRKNYVRAARAYSDFLDDFSPDPSTEEYQRGLYGYTRSMYLAGFRNSIRQEVMELVGFGTQYANFAGAFEMLEAVVSETDVRSPAIEDFAGYVIGSLPQDLQDEWNTFMGQYFRIYGDSDRALQFFARVSNASPEKARTHYLSAVMHLERRENRRAVQELQQAVLRALETDNEDVTELAYLGLARILYEIGDYDAALYYYNKIGARSHRRPTALFEQAWTYFQKLDFDRAVGALHTLQSPFYNYHFWPELWVIEAAAYLQTCNLREAELAIQMFDRDVAPLVESIQDFLGETGDPEVLWDAVARYHELYGSRDEVDLPVQAIRTIIRHPDFRNRLNRVRALEAEIAQLRESASILGEYAEGFAADFERDLRTQRIDGGLWVSQRLLDFEMEVSDWSVSAQEVGIDVTMALIDQTRQTRMGQSITGAGATSSFVLAQDWQFWPYESEYWLDEVDNYRALLLNYRNEDGQCVSPELEPEEE